MQLNLEQKKLIQMEPTGHCLIKGVAGSGKTTVAVHRIPYLMNHYCYEKEDQILLVTFNKTLLNYIKYLYDKVENPESQLGMAEIMNQEVKVDIRTIDSIVFKYYRRICPQNEIRIASNTEKYRLMSKAIHLLGESENTPKVIHQKNTRFLLDEVEWIDACLIDTMEDYQQVDRIGRASNMMEKTPQKLLKNSEVRRTIYELKELYQQLLEKEGLVGFRQMNREALKALVKKEETYTHIIIDESQDLTKAQLEMIKKMHRSKHYASITFIADNAQSIYSHSWLGKGRSYTTLGFDMSGKSRTLAKNYRTTTQISEAAYSLLEKDENLLQDHDFVKPSLVDRQGEYPVYRHFATLQEEMDYAAEIIQELSGEYLLSDICMIAKEKRLAEEVQQCMEKKQIPCEYLERNQPDFERNKVKVTTMHSIKGLEFKVVIIIGLNEGVIPYGGDYTEEDNKLLASEERKLLYVGMTRANELLYLSSHQKPSRFIQEIDHRFLRFKRNSYFKPLYRVAVMDYMKQDQILDLYAKEELIRQWVLRELVESYGYKESMIEVEFPVNHFSQKGYADLVVNVYHQGKEVPFILGEIKKYMAGIESAEKQAVSYMQSIGTIRYCLITDGYRLKIMDRDQDEINDIPRFNPGMLPDTIERFRFKSYRNQQVLTYERDADDPEIISVKLPDTELNHPINETTSVAVYGDIAAGDPIEAREEIKEQFLLPSEWILQTENAFMLEVAGDSMQDAGIDIGDYVLVNRQNSAENGQIVIALLDGEATLKKYMQMGDSVLLIPENTRYEPINVKPEQVMINGIVIGVLKKLSRS